MEIVLAKERLFILKSQMSMDEAEQQAWGSKLDAFGTIVKMTRFFQRPKDEDFSLMYKELRLEPVWHVVCQARYVYERNRTFELAVSGPEVKTVTIGDQVLTPEKEKLSQAGIEHCEEEFHKEVFVNGLSKAVDAKLEQYLSFEFEEIPAANIAQFGPEDQILIPSQMRASAVVREPLVGLIKNVQADRILEDRVEVEKVDLYYRPVYAFRYSWISKEREGVLEIDGLTGRVSEGEHTYQQYIGRHLDPEFLFDLGTSAADLPVPKDSMLSRAEA